ncbi:hypothetical protein ABBQ38_006569 [Trebouxia sp. C0009 RCD-2024]
MNAGSTGCLRQRLVTSSPSSSTVPGIGAIAKRQFGGNRLLHKRVHSHGARPAKQRCSRVVVSVTKDLSLPVILDRDFDKEGSRVYKRTVFNFGNWATHRSTKRYGRHIYTIIGASLFENLH